ncbi:MAG: V-type ATP synthase subunit D [Candidatus Cryosericum sp.]|jgi:V/A-type H+-transporting ATPase subunit D|nr:V-type ATP synthase subunit D [Candidatus Cryosericum sp.]HPS70013.1 V-type ATP synthase subunit D [Candidatus Cryosericum sp.]
MILKVNPTRMELLRLQKRYTLARRGHKLLKDKLEGLMKTFIRLAQEYGTYRARVDRDLPDALATFKGETASYPSAVVELLAHTVSTRLDIDAGTRSIMNVPLPTLAHTMSDFESPAFAGLEGAGVEASLLGLYRLMPSIVRLAEIEASIRRMAEEIERTRRRVNALEYVMIPNLEETIRFISSKLDENERANTNRLLKVKEIIQAR